MQLLMYIILYLSCQLLLQSGLVDKRVTLAVKILLILELGGFLGV